MTINTLKELISTQCTNPIMKIPTKESPFPHKLLEVFCYFYYNVSDDNNLCWIFPLTGKVSTLQFKHSESLMLLIVNHIAYYRYYLKITPRHLSVECDCFLTGKSEASSHPYISDRDVIYIR